MKTLLKNILDDEFLETLAKSADLYKIGSNTVLDPEEIRIGLKVVPRAVMSMLISELVPMEINSSKNVQLPFGKMAYMACNKNAADDFTGSVYSDNKLVYSFRNRSIPGLGIILLSTFELYDVEKIAEPYNSPIGHTGDNEDLNKKVQKLIDERMELHSLVGKVVEDKISQRDAIQKLMMFKLQEALAKEAKIKQQITNVANIAKDPGNAHANEYMRGMANGVEVTNAVVHNKEPDFVEAPKKPLNLKPEDIAKKEAPISKGSPLKDFLDRKKPKEPKEHTVEMIKSEAIGCDSCGQIIFSQNSYSGCLCLGPDQYKKIWLKKTEGGVKIKFSKGWDEENIEQLLETLRSNNGKH